MKSNKKLGRVPDGDEVVISTMAELPRVALQEIDNFYVETKEEEEIEEELFDHENKGQRSTIETSFSRTLGPTFGSLSSRIINFIFSSLLLLQLLFRTGRKMAKLLFDPDSSSLPTSAHQQSRIKDLRDKFHSGSIKVTSNPRRIRDFLYFRSLKLDPGEALIAQVE